MNVLFQSAFNIDLKLDPLWCVWFTGWIDGEGCFTTYIRKYNLNITPSLKVKLRDDDSPLIYTVREILNCGNVFHASCQLDRSRGKKTQDAIKWECANISQCRHILIPLFDQYPLRSKKARDYIIWRKLVMMVSEDRHLNGDRETVLDLCRQLKEIKYYASIDKNDPCQ